MDSCKLYQCNQLFFAWVLHISSFSGNQVGLNPSIMTSSFNGHGECNKELTP